MVYAQIGQRFRGGVMEWEWILQITRKREISSHLFLALCVKKSYI